MTDGAVSLVTGSARGLGLATARHLRDRGDRTHVVWRAESERARALCDEFGACSHRGDLTVSADAQRVVAEVLELDGRIDHELGEVDWVEPPKFRELVAAHYAAVLDERDKEWLNEMSRQITPVEGQPGMAMTEVIHKGLASRMGYEQRRKKWVKRDVSATPLEDDDG